MSEIEHYDRGLEVIMNNHHTRKWMWELLTGKLGWGRHALSEEPYRMAAVAGQQVVGEALANELRRNHFTNFIVMQKEAHNREVEALQKEKERCQQE